MVETEAWEGTPALDFVRRELGLTGTKEGCREGDCGACAVLLGRREDEGGKGFSAIRYLAVPSCLLALGELDGAHLVTIEGLSDRAARSSGGPISPVARALLAENGSQCGFCTPGFVISLTAFLLEGPPLTLERARIAIEGNLCRCTGYASILRAASRLVREFHTLPAHYLARIEALEHARVVPVSLGAYARGELLPAKATETGAARGPAPGRVPDAPRSCAPIGGGTDFYVRNPDPERCVGVTLLDRIGSLRGIRREGVGEDAVIAIGAAVTWREFLDEPQVRALVPGIERFEGQLASALIRNRATVAGNIANASPAGDMTSMLIALGARLRLCGPGGSRESSLEGFFIGYKKVDLAPGEIITGVVIPAGRPVSHFNFEKVAKRAHLDIASVNSAASFELAEGRITRARISAGGVAPVPLFLEKASAYLAGRAVTATVAREGARIAASEVSPISDVRGSAGYRRRLLERLVLAHFLTLFPESGVGEEVRL